MYFDFPHYPFQPPPELHGQQLLHSVAIIGAGPVGLTLALGLARRGIPWLFWRGETQSVKEAVPFASPAVNKSCNCCE